MVEIELNDGGCLEPPEPEIHRRDVHGNCEEVRYPNDEGYDDWLSLFTNGGKRTMSTDPKPINKPIPVCHICGRPAVAYNQHRQLVCAIHTLHPYSKFNTVGRGQPKVGRNAPCPCGSEKRFKVCCGKPMPLQIPGEKMLVEETENA